jgi:hypothetical protein
MQSNQRQEAGWLLLGIPADKDVVRLTLKPAHRQLRRFLPLKLGDHPHSTGTPDGRMLSVRMLPLSPQSKNDRIIG